MIQIDVKPFIRFLCRNRKNTQHFTLKDYKRSKDQGLFYWSDKYLYNINSTDNKDTLRIYSLHENKLIKEKELPDMKAILSKH